MLVKVVVTAQFQNPEAGVAAGDAARLVQRQPLARAAQVADTVVQAGDTLPLCNAAYRVKSDFCPRLLSANQEHLALIACMNCLF